MNDYDVSVTLTIQRRVQAEGTSEALIKVCDDLRASEAQPMSIDLARVKLVDEAEPWCTCGSKTMLPEGHELGCPQRERLSTRGPYS